MIGIPNISQMPIELSLVGGLGLLYAQCAKVNKALSVMVLMVRTVANNILFYGANEYLREHLNISAEALKSGIDAGVSTATIITATKLNLISKRAGCLWMFVNLAVLCARMSILYTTKPPQAVAEVAEKEAVVALEVKDKP